MKNRLTCNCEVMLIYRRVELDFDFDIELVRGSGVPILDLENI